MSERIYGMHAVHAVLARTPRRVRRVYLQRGRDDERAQQLAHAAAQAGIAIERVEAARLAGWLGTAVHQGVAAEVEPLQPWREDDLLAALSQAAQATPPLVLALDGVQDPHNLGACLRTADACGVLAVMVPRDRAAGLSPAARKVAAGGAETTPLVTVTNLARSLDLLKQAGLWIVGAEATAEHAAHELDLTGARCVVMGAEGTGLRALTRKRCDQLARLPSLGAVGSLNVAVATGMMLYEVVRQRSIG